MGVSGKLVFAEQEATENGSLTPPISHAGQVLFLECVSVEVPVGFPWEHGHSVSKLTPLKYYHDITISNYDVIMT